MTWYYSFYDAKRANDRLDNVERDRLRTLRYNTMICLITSPVLIFTDREFDTKSGNIDWPGAVRVSTCPAAS